MQVLQKLCGQFGAKGSSKLAKNDAIAFLRKKLNVPDHHKKIFTKIWGASGGCFTLKRKNEAAQYNTVLE